MTAAACQAIIDHEKIQVECKDKVNRRQEEEGGGVLGKMVLVLQKTNNSLSYENR